MKYPIVKSANKPTVYDNIHTNTLKPIFTINGVRDDIYKKDQSISLSIASSSPILIKKIDVFVNSRFLPSFIRVRLNMTL